MSASNPVLPALAFAAALAASAQTLAQKLPLVTDADIAEALSVLDGVAVSFEERGQSKAS